MAKALRSTRFREGLGRLARRSSVPASPCLALWQLPQGQAVEAADLPGSLPELLAVHVAKPRRAGRGPLVLAFWPGSEALEREREGLERLLGLTGAGRSYSLRGLRDSRVPFWKRIRLSTWLLATTSFLGGVNALYTHYDSLFTAPHLELALEKGPLDAIAGSPLGYTLQVENGTSTVHRNLSTTASLTRGEELILPLESAPTLRPRLEPGASHEFELEGTAPEPGVYDLVVQTSAKAGWLRGWLRNEPFPLRRRLRSWSESPVHDLRFQQWKDGFAELTGRLQLGPPAPAGIECSLAFEKILVTGPPNVFATSAERDLPVKTLIVFPSRLSARGPEDVSILWTLGGQQGFQDYDFSIFVPTPLQAAWDDLEQRAELNCSRMRSTTEVKP